MSQEKCMIVFCQNKGKMLPGISYFQLSKNRYHSWLEALGIDPAERKLSYFNKICSAHFNKNDIIITPRGRMTLRRGAIPKLHLGPNAEKRKYLLAQRKAGLTVALKICQGVSIASSSKATIKEESSVKIEVPHFSYDAELEFGRTVMEESSVKIEVPYSSYDADLEFGRTIMEESPVKIEVPHSSYDAELESRRTIMEESSVKIEVPHSSYDAALKFGRTIMEESPVKIEVPDSSYDAAELESSRTTMEESSVKIEVPHSSYDAELESRRAPKICQDVSIASTSKEIIKEESPVKIEIPHSSYMMLIWNLKDLQKFAKTVLLLQVQK